LIEVNGIFVTNVDHGQLAGTTGKIPGVDQVAAGNEVWKAITDLFFSAENQDTFVGVADELGLSPPMVKALLELEPGEGRPMRSLAHEWGCDASFVTVVVDGLEERGYAVRRVADYDRRVRTVELTDEGVDARERALEAAYGARSGFWDLTPDEQVTLAALLRKLVDAQAVHDEELLASGRARSFKAGGAHVGHKAGRGRPAPGSPRRDAEPGDSWRDHLEAHREELRRLRDELARVRDEVRAQARRPIDEMKAAKADVKAEVRAAKADVKAQLKGRNRSSR
jgi:DNA-binding MarR family transcriptional regulator